MTPSPELLRILHKAFDDFHESRSPTHDKDRWDFAFHMTDWLNDLKNLNRLYRHPVGFTKDEAGRLLFGFLIHAVPHLKEAARLFAGDIGDAFGTDRKVLAARHRREKTKKTQKAVR